MNKRLTLWSFLTFTLLLWLSFLKPSKAGAVSAWERTSLNKAGLTSIEVATYGIFVGQKNDNSWENPYNGIFFSGDFGKTWREFGLQSYGITDIKVRDNKIYAVAYYSPATHPGGLYYSEDFGETWEHKGDDFYGTCIEVADGIIYLGTHENGLWVSRNNGITWEHAFSEIWGGPHIEEIYVTEDKVFAKTSSKFIYSTDAGKTWQDDIRLTEIYALDLLKKGKTIYAGTKSGGLYVSNDMGGTWEATKRLKGMETQKLGKAGRSLFAATITTEDWPFMDIYISKDQGTTWQSTYLHDQIKTRDIKDSAEISRISSSIFFAILPEYGLYKLDISYSDEKYPFLGKLWKGQEDMELMDKITSFFDHEYPLLGYGYYSEPPESAHSTLNFLGQEEEAPKMYYSSHNGYDFALSVGTEITAPAPGLANYYYCTGCGNSIKIDHQNGYETTYMHFQEDDLLTKERNANIPVEEGTVIGKVGMTGNTTGPHLHFQIEKDTDSDGNFVDDYPSGMVDPFGWKIHSILDPWPFFEWDDSLGTHKGTPSKYLWKENWAVWEIKETFERNPVLMELSNIKIETTSNIAYYPLNLTLQKYGHQKVEGKKYIENTSFLLKAESFIGEALHKLSDFIKITIKLPDNLPEEIDPRKLDIFHWNEDLTLWEKLETIFIPETFSLQAETDEISKFAVFAEDITATNGQTSVYVEGKQENDWFVEYPLITMTGPEGETPVFSIEGGTWQTYTEPFYLQMEGLIFFRYLSKDPNNNQEITEIELIKVDTQGKVHKSLKFNQAKIVIQ